VLSYIPGKQEKYFYAVYKVLKLAKLKIRKSQLDAFVNPFMLDHCCVPDIRYTMKVLVSLSKQNSTLNLKVKLFFKMGKFD